MASQRGIQGLDARGAVAGLVQGSQCAAGARRFRVGAIVVGRDKDGRHLFVDGANARLHPNAVQAGRMARLALVRDVFSIPLSL
jgi:hypothetical protein